MIVSLTEGKITKNLVLFSIPLILGNLLQTLYNTADSIIVGRFLGQEALAAVGSAYSLMTFISSILIGLTLGSGIVFSYLYGSEEKEKYKRAIALSFSFIFILSLLITATCYAFIDQILTFQQVPFEIREMMKEYLLVIFSGIIATFIFNFYSTVLRSLSESTVPLAAMAISAVMNVALDLYFVASLGWGIWGAAFATVISQYASAVFLLSYTLIKKKEARFGVKNLSFDRALLAEISRISIITSAQQSVMNFGILLVQGLVNSFGTVTMAAFSAGVKIDSFAYLLLQEFSNALSFFISQNMGAGKKDRVRKGILSAAVLISVFSLLSSFVIVRNSQLFASFFISSNPSVTEICSRYLHLEGSFYILIGFLFMFYAIFRSLKMPSVSLVLTIISLGLRVILAYMLSKTALLSDGIWISIPLGWAIADAAGILFYISKGRKKAL